MRRWWASALVILLAGCSQPADEPMQPEAPPVVQPAPAAQVWLYGCSGHAFVMFVPPEWVTPLLPPGYGPTNAPNPHLIVQECPAIQLDDTVYRDVRFAITGILLGTIPTDDRSEANDFYLFEVVLDVDGLPALADAFRQHGWTVIDGSADSTSTTIDVTTEAFDYHVASIAGMAPYGAGTLDSTSRFHQEGEGGHAWFDLDGEQDSTSVLTQATLAAEGGAWGTIAGASSGQLVGVVENIGWDGILTFERSLEDPRSPPRAAG